MSAAGPLPRRSHRSPQGEGSLMSAALAPRIALLYPGDRAARDRADPAASRFAALFDAFAGAGMLAEPAVWHDDFADEVRTQLLGVQAVLVWCNPIEDGRRRDRLDALLREVAQAGVLVSAHPDAILALGTKDVLVQTRDLPFGSDVHRIDSPAQLVSDLPARLRTVRVCSSSTVATAASACGGWSRPAMARCWCNMHSVAVCHCAWTWQRCALRWRRISSRQRGAT